MLHPKENIVMKYYIRIFIFLHIFRLSFCVFINSLSNEELCYHNVFISHKDWIAKLGDVPYDIEIKSKNYIIGEPMTVNLFGSVPITGIIIQARKYKKFINIGSFDRESDIFNKANCDSVNDTAFQWFSEPRFNISITWTAPLSESGTLHFVATVFSVNRTFWTNVTSKSFRMGQTPIDTSSCGISKGCSRWGSKNCTSTSCDYFVTYQKINNKAIFELSSRTDWALIAFSADEEMGGNNAIVCLNKRTGPIVSYYSNHLFGLYPIESKTNLFHDVQIEVSNDGRLLCRFTRPLNIQSESVLDLDNDWYHQYAWGFLSPDDRPIKYVHPSPMTSKEKISLKPYQNIFLSSDSSFIYKSYKPICILLLILIYLDICYT